MMADKYDAFLDAPDTPVAKTTDKYDAFLDAPVAQLVKQGTPGSSQEVPIKFRHSTNPRDYQQQENLGVLRDFFGGASSLMRGGANIVGSVFGNSKIGEKIWPTALANKDSMAYVAGQIADPAALALGGAATTAAGMLPVAAKLAPVVRGAIAGGLSGAATGAITNEEDRLGGAGTGAVVGGAVGGVVPIAGRAIQKGVGWASDVAKGRTGAVKAGQIARTVVGDKADEIANALNAASPDLTAAQAASGVQKDMWQSLGKVAQSFDRNDFYSGVAARQEAARKGLLTSVTPDLAKAEAARSGFASQAYPRSFAEDRAARIAKETSINPTRQLVITNPKSGTGYYKAGAPAQAPVAAPIKNLLDEPIFSAAKTDAIKAIKEDVRIPQNLRDQITESPERSLQGLHAMKTAIDAQIKKPIADSAMASYRESSLKAFQKQLIKAMDDMSGYGANRQTFAELSKPVNQANVLRELSSVLEKPMVGERSGPFVNALGRGEDAALRRAGLDTRFTGGIEDVLTPSQMSAVNTVKSELAREAAMEHSAKSGAEALRGINSELAVNFKFPSMIRSEVSVLNKILEVAERKLSTETKLAIAEGMRSGKTAVEMLNTLPTSERNKLLMLMGQAGKISGSAGAISGAQAAGETP